MVNDTEFSMKVAINSIKVKVMKISRLWDKDCSPMQDYFGYKDWKKKTGKYWQNYMGFPMQAISFSHRPNH